MKLTWCYDACGYYANYKGFTIINQEHPSLIKYEITKEDKSGELIHVGLAATVAEAKKIIHERTSNVPAKS